MYWLSSGTSGLPVNTFVEYRPSQSNAIAMENSHCSSSPQTGLHRWIELLISARPALSRPIVNPGTVKRSCVFSCRPRRVGKAKLNSTGTKNRKSSPVQAANEIRLAGSRALPIRASARRTHGCGVPLMSVPSLWSAIGPGRYMFGRKSLNFVSLR